MQKDKINLSSCVKYSAVNRLSVREKGAKNREGHGEENHGREEV